MPYILASATFLLIRILISYPPSLPPSLPPSNPYRVKCREIPDKRRLFVKAAKAFILGVFKLGTYWTMYT